MIYFLGGGNMAAAIVSGLCAINRSDEIFVANRGQEKREALAARFGIQTGETLPLITQNDVLVLAVKPQDMRTACADIRDNGALVVSVAAGLSVDTLSGYLGGTQRIIRVMPNTPAQIGQGISGLFAADGMSDSDKIFVQEMMNSCGTTIWLDDEAKMHAITAVSGSGSAYVFYLLNALQEAAKMQGFDTKTARQLSLETFAGAVALAAQSGEDFVVLHDKVTSKGGTTFAALETFAQHHLAQYLAQGVQAAATRSIELSQQFESK